MAYAQAALDAITNTAPEAQKRAPREAVFRSQLPEIAKAASNGDVKTARKIIAILKRASKATHEERYSEAAALALKALDIDENSAIANHVMAMALDRMGHLSRALSFYERAWKLDPTETEVYANLGMVAWKLDMLDAAEKFFRLFMQMLPESHDGPINLAGVLRDKGKYDDAIEILRARIYGDPEHSVLWNALGTILLEAGDPDQSVTFFTESLRLDPGFARAWHNLAYAQALIGDMPASVDSFDRALPLSASREDAAEMRHGRALSLFACSRVKEGWEDYAIRLDPTYREGVRYMVPAPRWQGEDVSGKAIAVIGEQGLGDEVLFANAMPDLIRAVGPSGRVIFAPEKRLNPLMARSFPKAEIFHHGTAKSDGSSRRIILNFNDWANVDYWAPLGTVAQYWRPDVSAWPGTPGYLTPDPERVTALEGEVSALPTGLKVGICWKSMLMTARRTKFFSPFEYWKPVLAVPGVTFISLQYGDADADIAEAQKSLGVTIHTLSGLDLKDDLEGIAALGQVLDLAIGPMNASTNLTAAAGGETWFLTYKTHWPLMGTPTLPWYPNSRAFSPPEFGKWTPAMAEMAEALKARASKPANRETA